MIPDKIREILKRQHYRIVGRHSAVQVCRWTKKSIRDEGVCYKEKFYGIKSHLCCQMTPAVMWCPNKCLHCWRAIELTLGEKLGKDVDSPSEIIDGCIAAQRKLLQGFNKRSHANQEKYLEAQEPMQFAISLSGEPTVYSKVGGLIEELRRRGKTSFLVTNGLYPEKLRELAKEKQLPTQLYISVNAGNKKLFEKISRSCLKDAWMRLDESLGIMASLKTRTVFRINLVLGLNMSAGNVKEFADLIVKTKPRFIEVKGFMSVGYARERLAYERMPRHEDIQKFSKDLVKELNKLGEKYKILNEQEFSRVCVLGKKKGELRIKAGKI